MTEDKGILIKNIFYMLSYVFEQLKSNNYENIEDENFENAEELFSEILFLGISKQLKQGLFKCYVTVNEDLTTLKGKIDLNNTIKNHIQHKKLISSVYDILSENNFFNQIIKSTLQILIQSVNVSVIQKHKLKSILIFFENVGEINISEIKWKNLRYDRNSQTYKMLHYICRLVIERKIYTTELGKNKILSFTADCMNKLFELFILKYYIVEHKEIKASAKRIEWNLKKDKLDTTKLPIMQTDIFLEIGNRILIIDAKYYKEMTQESLGYSKKVKSPHFYQIYSYVNNCDQEHRGNIDGLVLYAQTSHEEPLNERFVFKDGNVIMFKSIDLNQDFKLIKKTLDSFVTDEVSLC